MHKLYTIYSGNVYSIEDGGVAMGRTLHKITFHDEERGTHGTVVYITSAELGILDRSGEVRVAVQC